MNLSRKAILITVISSLITSTHYSYASQYFSPAVILETPNTPGVVVAVVDSGLDSNKSNLAKNQVLPGVSLIPGNVGTDNLGHGSVVASIISDPLVGGSSKIKIMPIKVYNNEEAASADSIARAIDYAVKKKVRVISISLGGPENTPTLNTSVAGAVAKGSLIIASSGNDGNSIPLYPASIIGVVSVGGIGKDFKPWNSSNRSSNLNFVAMSEGIDFYGKSTDGTSFAAPEVARVFSQLIASNPKSSTNQILTAARNSAIDMDVPGKDDRTGYGLIDYLGADYILKGNNPSRTNLTQSYENQNGKVFIKSILRTQTGAAVAGATIKHYAYLQSYRKNVYIGSSFTDSNGNSTFAVNIFGNGTLWSRSLATQNSLASASQPLDFTGLSGIMNFKFDGYKVRVSNSTGEPVVGYELPLWVADGESLLGFDQEISDQNGDVILTKNIVSDQIALGVAPTDGVAVKRFASPIIIKPILHTSHSNGTVLIRVTSKNGEPVAGFVMKDANRKYITDNQGQLKILGSSAKLSYKDPVNGALKTLNFAPSYKAVISDPGQWGIKVGYSSKAINGRAEISATVTNSNKSNASMSVDLELLNNGTWTRVATQKSTSNGEVKFLKLLSSPIETFRVVANTPSGPLITNSFDIPRN